MFFFRKVNLEALLLLKVIRKARYALLLRIIRRVVWFHFGDQLNTESLSKRLSNFPLSFVDHLANRILEGNRD